MAESKKAAQPTYAKELKKTDSAINVKAPAAQDTAPVAPAPAAAAAASPTSPAVVYDKPVPGSHTHDALKSGLPAGVDPTCKEEYLDNATFAALFNVDRAAFKAMPKWKRDAAKKNVGLF